MNKLYHYIYRIDCLVTDRYYIGIHSTNNIEDKYFGSGQMLKRSIEKHGKDAHNIVILEYCDNRDMLKNREKELVTRDIVKDSQCMNLIIGGCGPSNISKSTRTKISEANSGRVHTLQSRANMSIGAKNRIGEQKSNGTWESIKEKNSLAHRGKINSKETIDKRNLSIAKYKELNGGKRTYSQEAKRNISIGLKGNERNAKIWHLESANGEIVTVTNLSKWLKVNNLTTTSANKLIRNIGGLIIYTVKPRGSRRI